MESSDQLACPVCGKTYRWKAEIAGRKVRCKVCQTKLRVPMEPEGEFEIVESTSSASKPAARPEAPGPVDESQMEYELNTGEEAPSSSPLHDGHCPACNAPMSPRAVLCIQCGYSLVDGKRLTISKVEPDAGSKKSKGRSKDEEFSPGDAPSFTGTAFSGGGLDQEALAAETERAHFKREVIIPLILLGVGIGLLLINALLLFPMAEHAAWEAFGLLGLKPPWMDLAVEYLLGSGVLLLVQLPFVLAGIFITAALFSSSYGTLGKAMLKLIVLLLVTSGFTAVLEFGLTILAGGPVPMSGIMIISLSLGVWFGMTAWLFEMDFNESLVLWLILAIGPIVVLFLAAGMLESWGIPVLDFFL